MNMFDPTQRNVDDDVSASMKMFQRAQVGEVAAIGPHKPKKLLLVLDGSSQDELGVKFAQGLAGRFECPLCVVDAREARQTEGEPAVEVEDRAVDVAASLSAEAVEKTEGESFEQVLAAVEQTGCDLVIVPCPFGRDLEKVGPDSTGTVIDVLLARCHVPILVVRKVFEPVGELYAEVMFTLIGENRAAPLAAGWAAGVTAPQGHLQLILVLEKEFYENFTVLLATLDPQLEVSPEQLAGALTKAHMRLHRGLQKGAEEHGFRYELNVLQEGELPTPPFDDESTHPLVVVALEREDHSSQGHVRDRIRLSPNPVLVVPAD